MRQGHNKRMRGRNRKGPNPLSRAYESNGPDVKIRGTALHVAEKYITLARDAASAGDRVAEQNYLQHAEHYYRIVAAAQAQMPQPQVMHRADADMDEFDERPSGPYGERPAFNPEGRPQPYPGQERQPFVNGAEANGHDEGGIDDEAGPGSPEGEDDQGQMRGAEQGGNNHRHRGRRHGRGPRAPRMDDEAPEGEAPVGVADE